LRLTLPRLGTVDAVLQLNGNRLSIRVAADADSAADLRKQAGSLNNALTGAGLNVQSLEIRDEG
jgi:hypothetical protein